MTPEYIDYKTAKFLFGLGRSQLYALANENKIESVSIRKNEDAKKGRRLFKTQSIRDFLNSQSTHLNMQSK